MSTVASSSFDLIWVAIFNYNLYFLKSEIHQMKSSKIPYSLIEKLYTKFQQGNLEFQMLFMQKYSSKILLGY